MNQWIRGFCAKREYPFVNYYAEMADASGFLKPDLADDGLHPNAKGYRIMAPLALAAVTKAAVPPPPEPKQQRKRRLGIF
jgi:lysophospholipase L1-like esterase